MGLTSRIKATFFFAAPSLDLGFSRNCVPNQPEALVPYEPVDTILPRETPALSGFVAQHA